MSTSLGKWAAIDIETTGIDFNFDSIIDVGFLQFEDTKLVKKFSSLVRFDGELSQFIQKLTSIKTKMLKNAPVWDKIEEDLLELEGHHLLAHNASFEEKFLSKYFEENKFEEDDITHFDDSIFLLALIYPDRSSFSLESFIIEYGLRDNEIHRGYEDSLDMLKVILMAINILYEDSRKTGIIEFIKIAIEEHHLQEMWVSKFLFLDQSQLFEISKEIDFDLNAKTKEYLNTTKNLDIGPSTSENSNKFKQFEFSGEYVKEIFTNESFFKKIYPNYIFRESQLQMALKVGQSFKNNICSLIQAPTGTGKTLAYLIPSFIFSKSENEQILIATGTKELQEQAITKDIPLAFSILGINSRDLKVSKLIGSSNHYCELIYRNLMQEERGTIFNDNFGENYSRAFFDILFFSNAQNSQDKRITREQVPHVIKNMIREFKDLEQSLAVDFRACTSYKCPFRDACSYIGGLKKAKESDIIVGNHALMFHWPQGFPRPKYVVVDEAHKIENEATNAFALKVSRDDLIHIDRALISKQAIGSLLYLLSTKDDQSSIEKIRSESEKYEKLLRTEIGLIDNIVEEYFKSMPRYTSEYWNELPMIRQDSLKSLNATALFNSLSNIKDVINDLYKLIYEPASKWDLNTIEDDNEVIAFTRIEIFLGQVIDILNALNISLSNDEEYAHSIRYHEDYGYELSSSPIDIGKKICEGLLETSNSVIYTSATLANAKGDQGTVGVEWTTGYTYLDHSKRFKNGFYLSPVYDYKNKSNIYLCSNTPYFGDNSFVSTTFKEIVPLIRKLEGRTLLLFSARKRFEEAREILIKEFDGEIPLFIQGMGHNLVQEYKKSPFGILLGMEKFGEGIDIPGNALQFIFIDKIPDLRQDLVIQTRREFFDKTFGNEFNDYFLAHRARSLHQKLGRLLRTENDRGAAIVVDSRIKRWKTSTHRKFIQLMEPYNIEEKSLSEACSGVHDFIKS